MIGKSSIDITALDRLRARLKAIATADPTALMAEAESILREDNKRRALAGLDCNDRPMPATQRERNPALARRLGSGPPLAPRGAGSRIITKAETTHGRDGDSWFAQLSWPGFVAKDGRNIPLMHAEPGPGAPYPRRDMVSRDSPTALRLFREAVRRWAQGIVRGNG